MKPEDPWVIHAKQILNGEFDKCDNSTAESLCIGLRSSENPLCKKALAAICKLKKIKDPYKL